MAAQLGFVDQLLPFGGILGPNGEVLHIARSLSKVVGDVDAQSDFFDLFRVKSPRRYRNAQSVAELVNRRLTLELKTTTTGDPLVLRGHVTDFAQEDGYYIFNTAFGVTLSGIVDQYGLTEQDFSYADSSIDMLYVLKTQAALLADSQAMADRLKAAKDAAVEMALSDPLTGLPNRRALTRYLDVKLAKGEPERQAAILHVDLDRFKQVNDTLGHAAGDAVLNHVSRVLRRHSENGELASRIGGDEFVLVVDAEDEDRDKLLELAHAIIKGISQPVVVDGNHAQIGASVGISFVRPGAQKSVDDVLLEADLALYEVKSNGRGGVHFYDSELSSRQALVQSLSRELEPAIAAGQFEPFYQIQIDARSGALIGAEVLARWRHPKHGLLTPATFLLISERARLTEQIDQSIYLQALDQFMHWQACGLTLPHISFNITEDKLTDDAFLDMIERETDRRGLDRSQIMFELMETILIDGENQAVRIAAENLVESGFKLALDDFGTGRASIATLISVPVHLVKIDRAFVTGLHEDPKRQLLTQSIAQLCKGLNIDVLAEGVETLDEAKALCNLGCFAFQGYLFSRPAPPDQVEHLIGGVDWSARLAELGVAEDWPTRDEVLRHAHLG